MTERPVLESENKPNAYKAMIKSTLCIFVIFFALRMFDYFGLAAESSGTGSTSLLFVPGNSALSVSLTQTGVFYGTAAPNGVNGNIITVAGAGANVGGRISSTQNSIYLEVLTDGSTEVSPGVYVVLPVKGHRFEVDSQATTATADARITLKANSATNTVWPVPDLSGAKFVIREHVTIGDVFGKQGNILLRGTGSASTSDRISFFDNSIGQFRTYWFRKNAQGTIAQWRSMDDADATDYTNTAIPPGAGISLYRQPSAGPVTLHHIGELRETPFRLPLPAGYSLVSHSRPLDYSPAMARMFQSSGWVGTGAASSSDQVHVWNGSSYAQYWFRSEAGGSTQQWRSTNGADAKDYMYDSTLIHGDKSIFIRKQSADLDYLMDLRPGGAPAPSP